MIWKNTQIKYLIELYNAYRKAKNQDEKIKTFERIAKNRPLSDDLIGGSFYISPSYTDFNNLDTINTAYIRLLESFDCNLYWMRKYLHPKYLVKDLFFMPSALVSFLVNHQFKVFSSFLLSIFGWIATILISAYASELRVFIESIIDKLIEII